MTRFIRKSWLLPAMLWLFAVPVSAANFTVLVGGQTLIFSPATLTINVGDTVTFTNAGGFHNVSANSGAFRCAAGCDGVGAGSGNLSAAAWSSTVVFNTAGSFGYFCELHGAPGSGMSGSITVRGTTPPPPALGSGYTGAWYNPAEDGHGMFIEILPQNRMVAAWYVFTPGGQPVWIVGSGNITGNTAAVDAIIATGGRFLPNFNPAQVVRTAWGRMNFTFTDCNTGRMDYVSTVAGYGSGTMPLTRLTLPAGLTCTGTGTAESPE